MNSIYKFFIAILAFTGLFTVEIFSSSGPQANLSSSFFKSIAGSQDNDVDLGGSLESRGRLIQIGRFAVSDMDLSATPSCGSSNVSPLYQGRQFLTESPQMKEGNSAQLDSEHAAAMSEMMPRVLRNLKGATSTPSLRGQQARDTLEAFDKKDIDALSDSAFRGSPNQQIERMALIVALLDEQDAECEESDAIRILPMSIVRESPSYKSKCSTPAGSSSSSITSPSESGEDNQSPYSNSGRVSARLSVPLSSLHAISEGDLLGHDNGSSLPGSEFQGRIFVGNSSTGRELIRSARLNAFISQSVIAKK